MVATFGMLRRLDRTEPPGQVTNCLPMIRAILILISPATARRLHYVVLKTVIRYVIEFYLFGSSSPLIFEGRHRNFLQKLIPGQY